MLPKIECSDELLLGILNQDSGCSTELGLQHLDSCEHCQARIEELAANEQQWTLAREGLCSRVEGGLDIGNDFQNPTRFLHTAEHSSDWTDTMAKQLLQPPSHPEMLGRLGRYEIERLVGSGGMGVVFKAYDSELHRSVAIKMLAPHLSGSRSARERFAREARAAAAIVNDHVVPIHNVETEHATPYLVMQYIAGDSLQARLDRDGPLDICEILRIGMQVATGLAAAHAQGLIHRDVKPSNVMLDENVARALLTDFGLARTQDEACLTRSGFHPGTPHYMSPEQVRGEELDGRSDLFSLGCVLYALCTGQPPYRADSGYAVMRRITDEQPRSIREQNALIPEWLERVVMRLLEKDREARFQSAEELAQILEQCLAHVQKPATEPLPLAVVPKASFFDRGRIRNWILGGMASAFLFLAGVFIVLETNKGTITIKSEADNVSIRIKRSDQVVDEMVVSRTGKSVRLAAGEYVIEFEGDSEDLVVEGGSVSLVRGETKTLQIVYKKSDGPESPLSKGTQTREIYEKAIEVSERLVANAPNNAEYVRDLAVAYSKMGDLFLSEGNGAKSRAYYEKSLEVTERLVASAPENSEYSQNLATAYDKMGDLFLSQGNGTQAYEYAKKAREIRERLASIATSAMSESTSTESDKRVLHVYNALSPEVDFSKPKATVSTVASDLASVINDFNRVHTELLRSSNSLPLTEDELVASLWWQYSQSKLREEIRETVKEIVVTRKLPPGWFIKLNSREWDLPQQWWHEKPLSSRAIQINLIGKEGLATTIRNQFVSSDATSLQPPESPLKTAIEEFNKSHSEEPDLTLDETLAALSTIWGKQSWYSSDGLKPSTMDALIAAIDRQVMKGVKIELLRTYETGDDRFSVWSIRLVVQGEQDGSTQAFTIRERFQKVNSFSDETIHWGKPSDAGLQAGFRFKPAQTRYLAGQVVDVEFFYRTIHGKGLKASVPAAFHFNKIEIDLNRADDKQRLWVADDREQIIGGWREEMIGEQPTLFKNRKIRFVDLTENLGLAQQISDDWTTNVMLPINTKCDIAFDVPDFAEPAKKSGSLLTGGTQISILNAGDEKRPPANPLDSTANPTISYASSLQSALDSVKLKFDQGLATPDEVLTAEMNLVEAKIRIAEAENVASVPALLKEREDILQRVFLAAKAKYDAGLIGIDEFSRFVADLIHAKFTSLIVAKRLAESLDTVSQNDASIMLIEEFFVKRETLGANHPELLRLRDKLSELRFNHAFDEASIQNRLFELKRERQQLLGTLAADHPSLRENSFRLEAVTSIRSASFPKILMMLMETDPRRANLLPQEWKGKWVVESAIIGDGSPLEIAKGNAVSICNSTVDWHWGERREDYVVKRRTVNGEESLIDLHWHADHSSGPFEGEIQWLVEFRDNKLWIVRIDRPESPLPESVDKIGPGHTRFVLTRTDEQVRTSDTELNQPREENVFKSLEILSRSENIPAERFRAEANKIAKQIENEIGREGLWRAVELVISVDVRERKTNGLVKVDRNPHQPLIQLDGDLSELLDSTLPLQLRELGIELALPYVRKWIQVGYSWNIQSSQSFRYHLQQLHESRQSLGIDEAFLQSADLPNVFSSTTSAGLVAFLKETKGMPAILAFSRDLSISSVHESIKKNLGYDTIETLNDAFVKWIEEKYAQPKLLTTMEDVKVRSDSQLNQQPFLDVFDSEVTTGEASKVDSHSIETMKLRNEVEQLKKKIDRMNQAGEEQITNIRRIPFPKEMQGVWRINEALSGVGEENGRVALAQYANQIVTISDSTMFLQSNIAGNHWYLSSLDAGTSPMQVELSVRSPNNSAYKTFACLLEIQGDKLYLVRAQSPGFSRPKSVQVLGNGERLFVMSRWGENPMTPEELIQVAKELRDEKEDRTVRFKVESVHAPFVLGEPNDGHREGELHLDCRPDPHDFSRDQFLVVLTAECQKKLRSDGVDDITKHFLGKMITAKGPVRGVEYTARDMRGEHFHLLVDDPSKIIIDKSE